jgi:tetratricopeptide (TPR) repeat protein
MAETDQKSGDDLERAAIAVLNGRPFDAEDILGKAILDGRSDARHAEMQARLLYNRAVQAFKDQNGSITETLLRQALALAPEFIEGRQGLAEILFRSALQQRQANELGNAAATAFEAARLWPEMSPVLAPALTALAHQFLDDGLGLVASDPILSCRLLLSSWHLNRGDGHTYATARSLFVHLGTGELGKSVDATIFETALQRSNAFDTVALIGLANLRRRVGRLNTAEALCRRALAQCPDIPFAAGRLASILAEQGRLREADALYIELGTRYPGVEGLIRLDPAFFSQLTSNTDDNKFGSEAESADFVVFTGCDGAYFCKYIDAFANSVAAAAPQALLHIHIIAPNDAAQSHADDLVRRHPTMDIRITQEPNPVGLSDEKRRVYYACARFLRLPSLLAAYNKPILMLDVDLIILRSVKPLLTQMLVEFADLAMIHGQPRDPWCHLWADVLLVRPTLPAVRFLEMVGKYISHFFSCGKAAWFLDQVALFAVKFAGVSEGTRPSIIEWPMDLQNSDFGDTYFWSMHVSQPRNKKFEDSDLYDFYKTGIFNKSD